MVGAAQRRSVEQGIPGAEAVSEEREGGRQDDFPTPGGCLLLVPSLPFPSSLSLP